MKFYVPLKTIHAVQKVETDHPLTGEPSAPIDSKALKELVLLINSKDIHELPALSALLTRRERYALCTYLPLNHYKIEISKVARVLEHSMDKAVYAALFRVWENHPHCREALHLLGTFDAPAYRPNNFPVKQGYLSTWNGAVKPLLAVTQTCNDQGKGTFFLDRFHNFGFREGCALELVCHQNFFWTAPANRILQEGDERLRRVLDRSEKEVQEKILLHFLENISDYPKHLPGLRQTYLKAQFLWTNPHSGFFPKGYHRAFAAYAWWYNYYQMLQSFQKDADPRRIDFWKYYLSHCSCSRMSKHSMLVMNFGTFVAIEFESIGAFYLFRVDYFQGAVTAQSQHNNTTAFKAWLYNYADYLLRDTHQGYWEHRFSEHLKQQNIKTKG